jgi:hypothetical protein
MPDLDLSALNEIFEESGDILHDAIDFKYQRRLFAGV